MAAPKGSVWYEFATAPTVNDDGVSKAFSAGDRWLDSTTGIVYICTSAAGGAAVWHPIGGSVIAAGSPTNISIPMTPKGTGVVRSNTSCGLSGVAAKVVVTDLTTAGAVTYTAAQVKGGKITRDPNGAGRSDVMPTAALLVAALPGAAVGDSFEFTIKNTADAAEVVTVMAGTGMTGSGDLAIAQNESKRFMVVLTNVGSGTEAYTLYNMGAFLHNT